MRRINKIKRHLMAFMLSATLIMGCGITAHAASSATVNLYKSQYSSSSSTVGDSSSVKVYAVNYSSSEHKVKVFTWGAVAGASYVKLDSKTLDIGTTMNTKTVNGYSSSTTYYLELNVNGVYKNCSAYGKIALN